MISFPGFHGRWQWNQLSYMPETPEMASENEREEEATPLRISWRVHPFTEDFWKSTLLVVIIIVASVACALFTGWWSMAILAFVFLVVSMAPYLFPVRYEMDEDGILITFLGMQTYRGWEEFRNFYPHDVGVHLSTFKKPSRLDAFRGNFIRFSPDNREAILTHLEEHIKRADIADGRQGMSK